MLEPIKKKVTPCPRAKEKPQEDSSRDAITFKVKPHNHQRCSERTNKTLCAWGPRERSIDLHKRLSQTSLWGLSVSWRGTGQSWPAAGTGALAAAVLGGKACGIVLLKETVISLTIELPRRQTINWRTIIPKKFPHCCKVVRPATGFRTWGRKPPRECDQWKSWFKTTFRKLR